eukprot:COSAG01_NODE_446_length_16939_cov_19.753518_22_plen_212_part_00
MGEGERGGRGGRCQIVACVALHTPARVLFSHPRAGPVTGPVTAAGSATDVKDGLCSVRLAAVDICVPVTLDGNRHWIWSRQSSAVPGYSVRYSPIRWQGKHRCTNFHRVLSFATRAIVSCVCASLRNPSGKHSPSSGEHATVSNLQVTLRHDTDPWLTAMSLTGGSCDFGPASSVHSTGATAGMVLVLLGGAGLSLAACVLLCRCGVRCVL